jgi:hypothetical protein
MKTFKTNLLIGVIGLSCLMGCSKFLDEAPKTNLTEEQVYNNEENIELLLAGLYTQWRNTKQDRGGFMFTLGTDEAKQGALQVHENNVQAALDKYSNALNASNSSLSEQWNKRWPEITAAAKAAYYSKTPALQAQARFIRATLMFDLAMLW